MVNVFRYPYINIIWFCMHWLAMSNSCYNPFIYLLLNVSLFIRSRLSIVKGYLIKITPEDQTCFRTNSKRSCG